MQKQIKEEIKNPDFLDMYTRKTLREVMVALFPYETMMNKARMYRHLSEYAILRRW